MGKMHKIKVILSKIIWKTCGIHHLIGDMIMDLLGYNNYLKVMNLQKEKI